MADVAISSLTLFVPIVVLGVVLARAPRELGRWRVPLGLLLLLAYGYCAFRLTLRGRRVAEVSVVKLQPLWSYRAALSRTPEGIRVDSPSLLLEIIHNYLLFMPMGYLLAFTFPRTFGGAGVARGALRVMLMAFCCSLAAETAQLVLHVGWFEVDDVIGNTLGAVLGYLVFSAAGGMRARGVAQQAQSASKSLDKQSM